MPSILEQIDTAPRDNTIQEIELKKALETNFFDKQEHIDDIKQDLDLHTNDIATTLADVLEDCRNDILQKNPANISPDEKKILDLANTLLSPVVVESKPEIVDYGKLPDTEYLDAIAINLGKQTKDIKTLLIKNVKFSDYNETTIPLITKDDISVFLSVDIHTYDPQTQDAILFNIQRLLLDWNTYCHDKTNRTNTWNLQTIAWELHFYQKIQELHTKLSTAAAKKSILAGTYDLQIIQKQYNNDVVDKVFAQIVSELLIANNKNVKNIYKDWKENSPMWNFVKQKSETNLSSQNIYNSLYYSYIQSKLEWHLFSVYVDKAGKELAITDQQYETTYKNNASVTKLQLIKTDVSYTRGLHNFLLTTKYGKSLIDTSDTYRFNKEQEPYIKENQKNIAIFSDRVTTLQNNVIAAKKTYNSFKAPQLFQTNSPAYYKRQSDTKKAKESYEKSTKILAVEGNKAFVELLLRLNNVWLSPELKPYFDALNGGVNYRWPKKLPAPIGGAEFVLDFSKRTSNNMGTHEDKYIQDNVDAITRDSWWEKTVDAVWDIVDDIQKNPDKFLVQVGSIVGAWIVAGAITIWSWGTAIVAAAGVFTVTENLLRSTGMWFLEEVKWGNFWDGFEEAIGTKFKNSDWSYQSVWLGDFLAHKSFELGTNIVLFGPIGKVGWFVEKTALAWLEKWISLKATQNIVSKMGLEKIGAKTIWLFAEAGFFTWFNGVTGSLQQWFSKESWDSALKVENLASWFVHNLIFISALKTGNFLATPLQQRIIDKKMLDASKLWVKDVLDKQNLLTSELKKLKDSYDIRLEKKVATDGTEKLVWLKNNIEVSESQISDALTVFSSLNKQLLDAQNNLVMIQVNIAQKTDIFLQDPAVKAYNDFVAQNKLGFETLTPENVIDQRIQYFKKKNSTNDVAIWEKKKLEYKDLQKQYNTKLQEHAVSVVPETNTFNENKPTNIEETPIEEMPTKDAIKDKETPEMNEKRVKELVDVMDKEAIELDNLISEKQTDLSREVKITKKLIAYLKNVYEYSTRIPYLGKMISHTEHWLHTEIHTFKNDGILTKAAAIIWWLWHLAHFGFELYHLEHTIVEIVHGKYDHVKSEQMSDAANVLYTGINVLRDQLIHLDLRIKDNVSIDAFAKDLVPILDHQNNILEYKADLINLSSKYKNIDLAVILDMLPKEWVIDNVLHEQVLDNVIQSFEKTYGTIVESSPLLEKIASTAATIKTRRNARSVKNVLSN